MRRWAMSMVAGLALTEAACGGASFTNAEVGDSGPDSLPVDSAMVGDGATGSDGAMAQESGGGDSAAACPDVFGRYDGLAATGLGCADFDTTAPQCIRATTVSCELSFTSVPATGTAGAVNGVAELQGDGTFSNAALKLGSIDHSGCIGSWDAQSQAMSVSCGGTTGAQSCVVTMTRTNLPCP